MDSLRDLQADVSDVAEPEVTPAVTEGEGAADAEAAGEGAETASEAPAETGDEENFVAQLEAGKTADELVEAFARRTGLNPDDPKDAKTLKTFADQLRYIEELKKSVKPQPEAGQPQLTAEDGLTEFEKQLLAEAEKPAAAESPKPAQQQPAPAPAATGQPGQPPEFVRLAQEWKTDEDGLNALGQAYNEGNLAKAATIEQARFFRNFTQVALPLVEYLVQQRLQQRIPESLQRELGDVVPEVRRTVEERRTARCREFAIEQLAKTAAYKDLPKLFEEDDGPAVVLDGQTFPSTPLNRIIAQEPWILKIREDNADPETAIKLTMLARFRAAHGRWKTQQVDPAKAQKLMDAGKAQAARQTSERVRQGLNSGAGATTLRTNPNAGTPGAAHRAQSFNEL